MPYFESDPHKNKKDLQKAIQNVAEKELSIEEQLAALEAKKLELLEAKKKKDEEDERKRKEEEAKKPLTINVKLYGNNTITVKPKGGTREDLGGAMNTVPSSRWDTYSQSYYLDLRYYDALTKALSLLDNIKVEITEKDYETIEYLIRGPDVWVKLTEKDLTVKLKPFILAYHVFKQSANVAILNHNDHLYHVPKNEAGKLLLDLPTNAKWEPDALKLAQDDLELRKKIDEIALAQDAPEYDLALKNGDHPRPFQRVGVKFGMFSKERFGAVKVLIADETGLGKSLQGEMIAHFLDAKKVAVVCPATVKENWRRDIMKFFGVNSRIMSGINPTNIDMLNMLDENTKFYIFNFDILARPVVEKNQDKDGVIVEGAERYLWIEAINNLGFDLVIIDEAHRIKNLDAARTKAIRKLKIPNVVGLTATPVLNRPGELWSFFNLVAPDIFNSYEGFVRRYTDGKNSAKNVPELRNLLKPYMIRRVKKDVQKDLPPIVRETHFYEMTKAEEVNYRKLMNDILIDLKTGEDKGFINNILTKILRVKQYLSILKTSEVAEFVKELYDETTDETDYRKVLIGSQFVDPILDLTKHLGGEILYITGEHDVAERQRIVDEFQSNDRIHFLAGTYQTISEGLNITEAGHVVHLDFFWTPATHIQFEGRAYGRLSDSHSIISHYYAVQNSLDDWLQGILLEKTEMFEQTIEGVNTARVEESSIISQLFKAIKEGKI